MNESHSKLAAILAQKHPLVISAPMADYSDSIWRDFAIAFGADIVFTEMVAAEAIAASARKVLPRYLDEQIDSRCTVLQLFSPQPSAIERAAKALRDKKIIGIDLNFCCPMRRVTSRGAGAALLSHLDVALKIFDAAQCAEKPVSVKIRVGFADANEWASLLDFLHLLERKSVAFVTIHGRTAKQLFSGTCDKRFVLQAARELSCPVFATGDVFSAADAIEYTHENYVRGVMLGRGAISNFELFAEVAAVFRNTNVSQIKLSSRLKTMREFLEKQFELRGDLSVGYCKKFLAKLFVSAPNAAHFRAKLGSLRTRIALFGLIDEFEMSVLLAKDYSIDKTQY